MLIHACCDQEIDVFLLDYDWVEENGGQVIATRVPVEGLRQLDQEARSAIQAAEQEA